ncbi:hypothetical protein QBC46DRAFT_347074 [Diplogelasinospora grovesii]|uniref:Uncharacterized protein n=1 Tax=Diplogelasinospora grovesii TaxID=303347 RepID=A0AAN6RYW8_9PEZI|nr:hypothetical protein QBC46DRAFT_347074 [Diplogelasinospora grovesii]
MESPLVADLGHASPPPMLDFKPVAPAGPVEGGYVPIKEHLELQNKHRQLYEKYQQLENFVKILLALQMAGLQSQVPEAQATN